MNKPLEQKTVRPGSLSNYSFYYSNRSEPVAAPAKQSKKRWTKIAVLALVVGVVLISFNQSKKSHEVEVASTKTTNPVKTQPAASSDSKKVAPAAATKISQACAGNTLNKFISISVVDRKLWACEGTKEVYSAPVITGDERNADTKTPAGTYKIFAKEAKVTLRGSSSKGSWSFPVNYWMPFLENQYGTYGFHDATWKDANEFGKVDAYTSDKASNGCIEMTQEASAWLYAWAEVGTTLTVKA